jgi:SAM-dependent methyltransferase
LSEVDEVRLRYEKRRQSVNSTVYSPLSPSTLFGVQEIERALVRWIHVTGQQPVAEKTVLEVGCGTGSNLLRLVLLGFDPRNLVGNELLDDRADEARARLSAATDLIRGDAAELGQDLGPFDIVMQWTVFTSILDAGFQHRLAHKMWELVRPGGGILWYDFIYDNPANADVRGVPIKRIRELFPHGRLHTWRVTLAPPISRSVTRIHPSLYHLFNAIPLLRTHVLCWIEKPAEGTPNRRLT